MTTVYDFQSVGAGSLPTVELPGAAVTLAAEGMEAGELARRLREHRSPLFTTVHDHVVHLHVRTVQPDEVEEIIAAVEAAFAADEE